MNDFSIGLSEYKNMFPILPLKNKYELETVVEITSLYRKYVNEFLVKNTSIKKYDDIMRELGYPLIPLEKMDIYQYLAGQQNLSCFYLRSNLFIGELTQEERLYLVGKYRNRNFEYTPEVEEFVKNTLPRAIKVDAKGNGEKCNVFYGAKDSYYTVPNDALVIGLRLDCGNNENLTKEQEDELTAIMQNATDEIQQELKIETFVRQYTDNTVIPMKPKKTKKSWFKWKK